MLVLLLTVMMMREANAKIQNEITPDNDGDQLMTMIMTMVIKMMMTMLMTMAMTVVKTMMMIYMILTIMAMMI